VRAGAHYVDVEDWPRDISLLGGFPVSLDGAAVIAGGVFRLAELKRLLLCECRRCDEQKK